MNKGTKSPNSAPQASALSPQENSRRFFPIVDIGASAGGLAAMKQFLRHVPEKSGLAFVIVQHLDPTRKALRAELLQRTTTRVVSQAKDRTMVKPNCVYVIPPKDMSILNGVLHLFEPTAPRGQRLTIDSLFRSLADDLRDCSIGVITRSPGNTRRSGLEKIILLLRTKTGHDFSMYKKTTVYRSIERRMLRVFTRLIELRPMCALCMSMPMRGNSSSGNFDRSDQLFSRPEGMGTSAK